MGYIIWGFSKGSFWPALKVFFVSKSEGLQIFAEVLKNLVDIYYPLAVSRMDLIPFYARLVATLAPCVEDLALLLVDMLLRDFRFQVRKKDQIHIHSKIKNCRFIGEPS